MARPLRPPPPAHPPPLVGPARATRSRAARVAGCRATTWSRYLESYAAHHRLELRLGPGSTAVERADREADGEAGARWTVRLADGSDIAADHVVVATGYNHTPVEPDWPGLSDFTGEVVMARDYRNGRPYAGRDVLVVGTGNTGMEIATDLAEHGATKVWLSVRTPPHILPRSRMGWPAQATGILVRRLPPRLVDRVAKVLAVVQEPDLTAYGMPRAGTDLYSRVLVGRIPVQDVGIVEAIRTRQVEPVAAMEAVDGGDVVLADGSRLQPSVVVVATGYVAGLEPLVGHLGVLDGRGLPVVHGPRSPPGRPACGSRATRTRSRACCASCASTPRRSPRRSAGKPSVSSVNRWARSRSTSGAPSAVAGREHARGIGQGVAVLDEGQGGLPEHHRRAAVARVVRRGDRGAVARAVGRLGRDLHAEPALGLGVLARPLAGLGQHAVEQGPGRPEGEAREPGAEGHRDPSRGTAPLGPAP